MVAEVTVIVYLLVGLVYWLCMAYGVLRARSVLDLARHQFQKRADWLRLSVVVAACNEADKIEAAMCTLLGEGYPNLEIVLVDDRSTDGTGAAIDRLTARDGRLRAMHIKELPAGWLGKVHDLAAGLRETTGPFVLFTDADVHFRPGVLQQAVGYCLDRRIDHLAALPSVWRAGLLTDTMVASFLRSLLTLMKPPWRVNAGRADAYFGVGAFAFSVVSLARWARGSVPARPCSRRWRRP